MEEPVKIVELTQNDGNGEFDKFVVIITDGRKGRDATIYETRGCGEIRYTYTLKEFLNSYEQEFVDELELLNGFDFKTLDWRA
ncbi:UNVERIFIED_CONTAM: hypothetical protein RF648_19810 [Kocuria sp. CPCC 205274]